MNEPRKLTLRERKTPFNRFGLAVSAMSQSDFAVGVRCCCGRADGRCAYFYYARILKEAISFILRSPSTSKWGIRKKLPFLAKYFSNPRLVTRKRNPPIIRLRSKNKRTGNKYFSRKLQRHYHQIAYFKTHYRVHGGRSIPSAETGS